MIALSFAASLALLAAHTSLFGFLGMGGFGGVFVDIFIVSLLLAAIFLSERAFLSFSLSNAVVFGAFSGRLLWWYALYALLFFLCVHYLKKLVLKEVALVSGLALLLAFHLFFFAGEAMILSVGPREYALHAVRYADVLYSFLYNAALFSLVYGIAINFRSKKTSW